MASLFDVDFEEFKMWQFVWNQKVSNVSEIFWNKCFKQIEICTTWLKQIAFFKTQTLQFSFRVNFLPL